MTSGKKIVSACLAGFNCRYDCQAKPEKSIIDMVNSGEAIAVCPEELGGLPTPRPPAERVGEDFLTDKGAVVTGQYYRGMQEALEIAKNNHCSEAWLKSKSPMCGVGQIYDGSFSGTLKKGDGLFAEALKKEGIKVHSVEGGRSQEPPAKPVINSFKWKAFGNIACIQQLVFNILLTYFLFVAAYTDFIQEGPLQIINGIFTGSLFIMTLMAWNSFSNRFKNEWREPFERFDWFSLGAIILATILWHLFKFQWAPYKSIWLDEYSQFLFATLQNNVKNVLIAAGNEQQPPLDYYLTFFASRFSWSETAVRFHATLFGHLFIPVAMMSMFRFIKSRFAVCLATTFFFLNIELGQYASEARPYILSCVFAFFFINNFIESLQKRSSTVFLLSSQLVFCYTIGFQPPMIIFCLTLFSLPLLKHHNGMQTWRKLFFTNAMTALVYIPFLIVIIQQSVLKNQFTLANPFGDFLIFTSLTRALNSFIFSYWPVFIYIVIFILFWIRGRVRPGTRTFPGLMNIISIAFILLTPAIFTLTLKLVYNWEIAERYFVIYIALVPFFVAWLLQSGQVASQSKLKFCDYLGPLFIFALAIFFSSSDLQKKYQSNYNWKEFYTAIEAEASPGDVVIPWSFSRMSDWRVSFFISKEIYANKESGVKWVPSRMTIFSHNHPDIYKILAENPKKIFFISPEDWSYEDITPESNELFEVKEAGGVRYFVLEIKDEVAEDIYKFLQYWKDQGDMRPWNLITYESLYLLALNKKDFDLAKIYLASLMNYPLFDQANAQGQQFHIRSFWEEVMIYYSSLMPAEAPEK